MKRGLADGQISRFEYETAMRGSSTPSGTFAVAGSAELASRRVVKPGPGPWRARAETPLSARLYASGVAALNKNFAAWAASQLEKEPEVPIAEAARDYVSYASALETQFLTEHTDVLSFGSGDCGQLAHSSTLEDDEDTIVPKPRLVLSLRSKLVRAVSCGGLHNIAVAADGKCYTWGCNDEGSLGRAGEDNLPGLVPLPADDPVTGAAAGDAQTFAVTASGKVWGWGCYKDKDGKQWFDVGANNNTNNNYNNHHHRGGMTMTPKRKQEAPLLVVSAGVVHIRCGASFQVALTNKGTALTWGLGEVGELGRPVRKIKVDGEYDLDAIERDHLAPQSPPELRGRFIKTVGAGSYHTLLATESGVFATGLNNYGQLGVGDTENRAEPVPVPYFDHLGVVALDGGQHHSLALLGDGSAHAFGRADYGQLGIGPAKCVNTPGGFVDRPKPVNQQPAASSSKLVFTAISCGSNHNLAITRKGDVFSWGYGDMNALGLGTSGDDEPTPKQISFANVLGDASTTATLVAGGGQHSVVCATVKQYKRTNS